MKKVTVLIGTLNVGGTETQLATVLPPLAKRGIDVSVVVLGSLGPLGLVLREKGVPVRALLSSWQRRAYSSIGVIGRFLRLATVSVLLMGHLLRTKGTLHLFLPEATVIGLLFAKIIRFKGSIIASRRSLRVYQQRRPLIALLEKRLLPKATLVTGNSLAVVQQLEEEGLQNTRLIYNGLEAERFYCPDHRLETRKQLQIPADAFVVIQLANLHKYKGHAELLAVFAQLPPSSYLLCPGADAGMGEALAALAKHLGITERVLFLGNRPDVPNLLAAADVSVLFSTEEGFSNAILESMAAGLPVVARDVGGNKEAIVHGKTGYIVDTPSELLAALKELETTPQKRQHFGQEGRKRVMTHFSLDACVNAYEALYTEYCLSATARPLSCAE